MRRRKKMENGLPLSFVQCMVFFLGFVIMPDMMCRHLIKGPRMFPDLLGEEEALKKTAEETLDAATPFLPSHICTQSLSSAAASPFN
jgi:hypothetical protein